MTAEARTSGPWKRGRNGAVGAGLLLAAIVAAAAAVRAGLDVWPQGGDAGDGQAAFIDVESGGTCHLVPASCSSVITTTNNVSLAAGPVTIPGHLLLHASALLDGQAPAEALVLLITPPPRAA